MSAPQRTKQLRRAVLQALAPAHPYALAEDVLRGFVNDLLAPPLTAAEWSALLAWMDGGGFARRVAGALDPDAPEWVITELGRSLLESIK